MMVVTMVSTLVLGQVVTVALGIVTTGHAGAESRLKSAQKSVSWW